MNILIIIFSGNISRIIIENNRKHLNFLFIKITWALKLGIILRQLLFFTSLQDFFELLLLNNTVIEAFYGKNVYTRLNYPLEYFLKLKSNLS